MKSQNGTIQCLSSSRYGRLKKIAYRGAVVIFINFSMIPFLRGRTQVFNDIVHRYAHVAFVVHTIPITDQ